MKNIFIIRNAATLVDTALPHDQVLSCLPVKQADM